MQEWNGHLEISVSRPQLIENSQAIFASPNSYFTESIVLSCPGWPVKTIYLARQLNSKQVKYLVVGTWVSYLHIVVLWFSKWLFNHLQKNRLSDVPIDASPRETEKILPENSWESWKNYLTRHITQMPWHEKHWLREWAYRRPEFRYLHQCS